MSTTESTGSSTRLGKAWFWSVGVAIVLVGVDQLTKVIAEARLTHGQPVPVIGEVLQWRLLYNPGAAFSMGTSSTWIFTIISSVAVVALLWLLIGVRPLAMRIAMTLMLGGAAGNLYDRFMREPGFAVGHVVDFIALPNFPVFNVADMCITAAGVLFVALSLWPKRFGIDPTEER